MGIGQGHNQKEISYFYPVDQDGNMDRSQLIMATTNWWSQDASFKDARLIGLIKSQISYSPMEPIT